MWCDPRLGLWVTGSTAASMVQVDASRSWPGCASHCVLSLQVLPLQAMASHWHPQPVVGPKGTAPCTPNEGPGPLGSGYSPCPVVGVAW